MDGLEAAVGKVGRELELSLQVVRLGGCQTTSLDLERETDEIFTTRGDKVRDLREGLRSAIW